MEPRGPTRYDPRGRPQGPWGVIKKILMPLGIGILILVKYAAKLKFIIIPALKFFPILLKTGGTMLLTIGVYALYWGWKFAVGFVLLIFIHESGHLLAARRLGLKVGAPVFIPFMGAFIALKDVPRNAWIEAQVGFGGPLVGSLGAAACLGLYWLTREPIFGALAYAGFFLNLFNLTPIGFLDGGRVAAAISPWLWVVGLAILLGLLITQPNFMLFLILILSLPRVFSLFRGTKTEYYDVTPGQRWTVAVCYFGLIALLYLGMQTVKIEV